MEEAKKLTNSYLLDLLGEIESADPEIYAPQHKLEKSDEKIAVVNDPFLKKIFSLASFFKMESEQLKVTLAFQPDDEVKEAEVRRLGDKADALKEMFWVSTREKYSLWHIGDIGIRKGWVVVRPTEQKNQIPSFIIDLLGGGGR